jgi:hypothetical protein
MGVRTYSCFGNAWTCGGGQTVADDDAAHALGSNRLSGLVQSRYDDTAEVLREFVGRLGFSSSREGRYSGLAPRTANRTQALWDFHCKLRPGPGHVLADVSLIHPLAAFTFVPRSAPLATQPLFGTLTSAGTTTRTTPAPGMHSERYRLRPWGGTMQFLSEATREAFPQLGHEPASPTFTGSYWKYCAATCPACLRLLRRATNYNDQKAN